MARHGSAIFRSYLWLIVASVSSLLLLQYRMGQPIESEEIITSPDDRRDDNATRHVVVDTSEAVEEAIENCVQWNNSETWLNATRLGNEAGGMTYDFVKSMLLNYPSELVGDVAPVAMQQTLCHERSRFMTWDERVNGNNDGPVIANDEQSRENWALRFFYLAFHHHQHWPAVQDAKARFSCTSNMQRIQEMSRTSVGKYDFECPDAKFLVVSPAPYGLGATIRLRAVPILILGLMTDRVVLVINGAFAGPSSLQEPWTLASCDRRDMQCFFLPMSPCVLTEADLESAKELEYHEMKSALETMEFPEKYQNDRVLVMRPLPHEYITTPPPSLQEKLLSKAKDIVRQTQETFGVNSRWDEILRDASNVTIEDPLTDTYPYAIFFPGTEVSTFKAGLFYMLRPNLVYQDKMKVQMERIVQQNFDPEMSLGLPIRSSDKCGTESECMSFDTYMALAESMWQGGSWQNPTLEQNNVSIILTSESSEVMEMYGAYAQNSSFPFSFMTNDQDVMQGSGNPSLYESSGKSADDVMLSTIMALKMQLMAKQTMANCCSNFLNIVFDYLRGGCGLVPENTAQCLEHHPDSRFRLCCRWTNSDECFAKNFTTWRGIVPRDKSS